MKALINAAARITASEKRIAELERALILAIETIEAAYGSDAEDSETVQHLARILNKGAK